MLFHTLKVRVSICDTAPSIHAVKFAIPFEKSCRAEEDDQRPVAGDDLWKSCSPRYCAEGPAPPSGQFVVMVESAILYLLGTHTKVRSGQS